MHWAIMHKMCKTKYTELNTESSSDGYSTTLRTELPTYVEERC